MVSIRNAAAAYLQCSSDANKEATKVEVDFARKRLLSGTGREEEVYMRVVGCVCTSPSPGEFCMSALFVCSRITTDRTQSARCGRIAIY